MDIAVANSGRKGKISKRVEFSPINETRYNVAFGDVENDRAIKDDVYSGNNDVSIIMTTIVVCIYEFTSVYPDIYVYFKGSNQARTEFYRKILIRHYNELSVDFTILGIIRTNDIETAYTFDRNAKYDAFL